MKEAYNQDEIVADPSYSPCPNILINLKPWDCLVFSPPFPWDGFHYIECREEGGG